MKKLRREFGYPNIGDIIILLNPQEEGIVNEERGVELVVIDEARKYDNPYVKYTRELYYGQSFKVAQTKENGPPSQIHNNQPFWWLAIKNYRHSWKFKGE